MTYEEILYEVDDPIATITFNRPEVLNAFTTRMGHEVRHAVGEAERDPRVVGIVLTGAGRGFCAGADMNMLSGISDGARPEADNEAGPGPDETEVGEPSWGDDLRGTYTYLLSVPKPIIAAINGPIAGMAVPIALACDLRFMARDAVLTVAFSQRGLIAEWGVSWLLPRLVGSAAALDLLFSSRKVDGAECERIGLVNRADGRQRRRCGAGVHRRSRRALLAVVARGDEASGVPTTARGARTSRARSAGTDGRELRASGLRRRRPLVHGKTAAGVQAPTDRVTPRPACREPDRRARGRERDRTACRTSDGA